MIQSATVGTAAGRALSGTQGEGSRSMMAFELTPGGIVLPRAGAVPDSEALATLFSAGQLIWLGFDPYYNAHQVDRLGALLEAASARGLRIIPVLGQFVPTTQPLCYHQPAVLDAAVNRVAAFMDDFGAMPCLHVFTDRPALHFAQTLAPAPLTGCTCAACGEEFAAYAADRGFDLPAALPVGVADPGLAHLWQDFQAEALPAFALRLMQTTRGTVPLWLAR